MNLRFIETFVCVARLKSFRMAADRLNTSQAAISNRIASLEQEMGVRLFERGVRSVNLTPVGFTALPKAEKLLEVAADFSASVSDPSARIGSITIGVIDPIAYSWLPGFMAALQKEYPNVSVDLVLDNSLNLQKKLVAGEIDLGLFMGPVLSENLINIELFAFQCEWVSSPALDFPKHRLSLEELSRHPILAYSRNSAPDQSIRQALREAEISDARLFNISSYASTIRLALDGMGAGPLPIEIIAPQVAAGQLVVIDTELPRLELPCHAVFPAELAFRLPGLVAQTARAVASAFFQRGAAADSDSQKRSPSNMI